MEKLTDEGFLWKIISKLAPDTKKVSDWIKELKNENPELSNHEIVDYVGDKIVWTYASQGAALALPGAIPGLGTIVQIGAEVSTVNLDIALMIRNQTYLVFALGESYGIKGREALIQDTLICMGLWTNALTLTKSGAIRIGTKVAEAQFKKQFPAEILKRINRKVGTTILTKYGTKRGGIALGKLIPFGVGTIVGGGFNYLVMKKFKKSTIDYFRIKLDKK